MKNIENLTTPTRERTSVPISGLDLSTPDDLVKDGKCETLHNMRFNAEAWRPVHRHRSKNFTTTIGGVASKIVYKHPATDEENVYITRKMSYHIDAPAQYVYGAYNISTKEYNEIVALNEEATIAHFGNVLIFTTTDTVSYYILDRGKYKLYTPPSCAYTRLMSRDIVPIKATLALSIVDNKWKDGDKTNVTKKSWFPLYDKTSGNALTYSPDHPNHWHGELLLFTTFVLENGTDISPSPLHLITSYDRMYKSMADADALYITEDVSIDDVAPNNTTSSSPRYIALTLESSSNSISTPKEIGLLQCVIPTVRVFFPKSTNTQYIKKVAVWVTRVLPAFKYSFGAEGKPENINQALADNDLANQPFYLLTEIDVTKMAIDSTYSQYGDDSTYYYEDLELSKEALDNAIHNRVYTPDNNTNTLIPSVTFDYNRSLHLGDVMVIPFEGYNPYPYITNPNHLKPVNRAVYMEVDDHIIIRKTTPQTQNDIYEGSPFEYIISYPDFRAVRYRVGTLLDVDLTEAVSNNFSWFHEKYNALNGKFMKISKYGVDDAFTDTEGYPSSYINNNLIVSAQNNLLSFPFNRTYSIGSSSNRIIAMQSAAIKIGDEQVGALPLYVFTDEGIYALRAGESTLYSAVNPINHDRIINPSTVSVNGVVAYITEKGVHILTGEGSKVISTPIHGADGIPDINFLKSCVFLAPKQFNEIVLLDNIGDTHYVYNLDYGYWSTRELEGGKINTDELVDNNAGVIYDLNDEDESAEGLSAKIVTRPVKLGNVEYKRLETIIPRIYIGKTDAAVGMEVKAISDGSIRTLRKIASEFYDPNAINPIVLRRVPYSAKYFQIELNFFPEQDSNYFPTITHIDFEWYMRFSRRMR